MYSQYKGKKVYLLLADDTYLYGRLENYRGKLYQVTGDKEHIVFWNHEVLALYLEKSNNTLTIFI